MIEDCKFFTMFGVNDDPTDHMKCLLFKTCDPLEACDDCITGIYNGSIQYCPDDTKSPNLKVCFINIVDRAPDLYA